VIRNKKAMASIIDAFMFITVIGLIAAGMYAYSNANEDNETAARTVYDAFFSIELRTNDMFDGADTQCARMCDLVAAYMVSGENSILEYMKRVMDSLISPIHGYEFSFEHNGRSLTIGEKGERFTSKYSSEMMISDGNVMRATLSIY